MKSVSIATMRKLEADLIASGPTGYTLMRRAGEGAARLIHNWSGGRFRRVVALVGCGNNGGDALVTLAALGLPGQVYSMCLLGTLKGEAGQAARDFPHEVPVEVRTELYPEDFRDGDLILDGLLGIGFTGELRPAYRNFIEAANASGCPIVALDLPSGIDADTGASDSGTAIRAALTVTFGLPKLGLFRGDGPAHAGALRRVDIGIRGEPEGEECFFFDDARRLYPRLAYDVHKMERGRLLILAGSREYPGAAALTATAALYGGAGLVRLLTPAPVPQALPAALIHRVLPGTPGGGFGRASLEVIEEELERCDAVVAGPGWGSEEESAELLRLLLRRSIPLVLDADGLNTLARHPELLHSHPGLVVTPHAGEAHRLTEAFEIAPGSGRKALARGLAARLGAVVILKGPQSIVADPNGNASVNSSGTPALATAGSGDVLSGLLGALLVRSPGSPFEMSRLAAFIHGLTGETVGEGLIADGLPPAFPGVLQTLLWNLQG